MNVLAQLQPLLAASTVGDFLEYAVRGIPFGCVYALLAVGLTLNYKTSGVFNLAFAAQAYASAAVFYVVRKEHEWALFPAAFLSIVVVGAALGFLLDYGLYRHQRTASPLAKLVTSLGLLVAMPEMVKLALGPGVKANPPPLWTVRRTDDFLWRIGGSRFVFDAGQIATVIATVFVVLGLTLLFRRTALGLQMRAVVESPRLLRLQGVDTDRVAVVSWILSSMLAALVGVLLAPLFAQLTSLDFFTLLVAAIAACVVGNLTSISGAFLGGLALGILQAELAGFLPTDSVVANGLRPSLPFVVLFALLLIRQSVRSAKTVSDPLAGVDPPPDPPPADIRPAWMTNATRAFAVLVVVGGFALCAWVFGDYWVGLITAGVCLGVVMLSIVVTTGVGGTISLCQCTFAAIGALATAQLAQHDVPVLIAMVGGAVVAAAVGAVLGFPVIRLPGIYAALATLAFALFFEGVLINLSWVSGGDTPLRVPRPTVLGASFLADRPFLVLASVLFAVLGVAVIALREGTTGRFLDAVRTSDTAASSVGINPARTRLVMFVLGAGLAGLGGGLVASFSGQANYNQSFTFFIGLVWLVLVITAGSRSVQAAIISGISFFAFPSLLDRLFQWPGNFVDTNPGAPPWLLDLMGFFKPEWAQGVAFVLFGLGALTYAKHPEGIIAAQTSASIRRTVRFVERHRTAAGPPPSGLDLEASA